MGPNDTDVNASPDANRVHIFDTTLRDGEQSPGISLNAAEKVEIAQQLARLGVDVIEAGFPIASPGDFEAVQAIARKVEGPGHLRPGPHPQGRHRRRLGRGQGRRAAAHPHLHLDLRHPHQVPAADRPRGRQGSGQGGGDDGAAYCEDVEFSPMDASRSEFEFTAEVLQIAIDAGATVINVPDTVGYTTPEEYAAMWARFYELVPDLRKVETSVHCHDDLGLAVANSYAGVIAGCRQVECAINGLGERAGNCSLEEIAMLIRVREDVHGFTTGINTREIARTSRLVSRMTGYAVQPNKAIVGRNAFAHESGIHQDGVLKERTTFEIMDATEVGFESNSIVLGKHSGRHALKDALEQLGYKIDGGALNSAFKAFKEIADRKKQVTSLDLEAIVSDEMRDRADAHELASFEVSAASGKEPLAKIGVTLPSGEEVVGESTGDGPIDAVFRAIQVATGVESELVKYTVEAVTGGEDALGETTVMLRTNGTLASGSGVATDIIEASARAYLRALSNSLEGAATREAEAATADAAIERTGP